MRPSSPPDGTEPSAQADPRLRRVLASYAVFLLSLLAVLVAHALGASPSPWVGLAFLSWFVGVVLTFLLKIAR